MIKFIDLTTGNTYDGESPFIHWFDGECGPNLIYSKSICLISDRKTLVVSMPSNPVFKLLNIKTWRNSGKVEYTELKDLYVDEFTSRGTGYQGKYVHMFYIVASSEEAGEFIETISINETQYNIGIDIYEENESLYINMINNGINIPDSIQKSIYPVDVHEDYKDSIVLNRKWKELLSNYFDIMSNKGSYKSLINSLNWFEWPVGDIKIHEIWKNSSDKYHMKDLKSIINNMYLDYVDGFAKTTYLSITAALERSFPRDYDEEKNPTLYKIAHDWSIEDLSLKLSMLGNFYETYFMPIHLDLIHATIEDIVYSNTFKGLYGGLVSRTDYVYHNSAVRCNVKEVHQLDYVKARVLNDTLFANSEISCLCKSCPYDNVLMMGVTSCEGEVKDEGELKKYMSQRFNGVGCIVPVHVDINLESGDFIHKEILTVAGSKGNIFTICDNKILGSSFEFSILLKQEGEYDMMLQLHAASGELFNKNIHIKVVDEDVVKLKLYKVRPLKSPTIGNNGVNDYLTTIQKTINSDILYQYVKPSKEVNRGIHLSNVLVFDGEYFEDKYLNNHYFLFKKDTNVIEVDDEKIQWVISEGELVPGKTYTVCISKQFWFEPDLKKLGAKANNIRYNQYLFIPDFHTLDPVGGDTIQDYTIDEYDSLCVVPEFMHGLDIQESEWVFKNASCDFRISIDKSTAQPFILRTNEVMFTPGYYDVIFNYKMSDQISSVSLNSAFILKK